MHTGGNGSTDQEPVQRNVKGKKKKKKLLQKSSSDVDQGSQATASKGSGDAESAGGSCWLSECVLVPQLWNMYVDCYCCRCL